MTKVEQVFVNTGTRQLEAHYVFPLPKGAALQDFYLWINGKRTKGEMLEKQKATEIYEGIVRRLQDPGLLEYVDTDVFRARVFPVPANGEQRIELTFSQVLDFKAGVYRYHYPLEREHARRSHAEGEAGLHLQREHQLEDAAPLDLLADAQARHLAQG